MIDKKFFEKHQKKLLWAINTKIGRWLFGVEKMGHRAKGKKILYVSPNSITTEKGKKFETQFFCRPEYGIKLGKVFFWLPVHNFIEGWNLRPAYQLALLFLIGLVGFHFPIVFATTTEYTSNAGGDGNVGSMNVVANWAGCRAATGANINTIYDTTANTYLLYSMFSGNGYCLRGHLPFNTDGLAGEIESAFVKYYITNVSYQSAYPDAYNWFNIVQSTEADPTDLVLADYQNIGNTKGSADKSFVGLGAGYCQLDFNATGLTWINTGGYTKIGWKEGHDFSDASAPAAQENYVYGYFSENASNKPVLSITHTIGLFLAFF